VRDLPVAITFAIIVVDYCANRPCFRYYPKSVSVIPNEMRDLPVKITDAIFIVTSYTNRPCFRHYHKSATVITNDSAAEAFFVLRNAMKDEAKEARCINSLIRPGAASRRPIAPY
jgi:hypothetical protein